MGSGECERAIESLANLNLNLSVLQKEPMAKHTSFKIGGDADIFITVNSKSDLAAVIEVLNEFEIPFLIVGNGSNLLVSDNGIRGAVIKLDGDFNKISLESDDTIECGAGAALSRLCTFALKKSLSGLEFAYGIPGTVGGAVFMNAGAYGEEIKDAIVSAESMTYSGKLVKRTADEMDLSYRSSLYRGVDEIILSAKFKLKPGDKIHIKERMDGYIARRKEKQPLNYPNAGSIFKRPVGNFAGTLIQNCGLKGAKVGGAMVSTKHAGFIINQGGATCNDVIRLIDHIKETVMKKTGVALECEVIII